MGLFGPNHGSTTDWVLDHSVPVFNRTFVTSCGDAETDLYKQY